MGVRQDAPQFHIDRQYEFIGHEVVGRAGGDFNGEGIERHLERDGRARLVREIQGHFGGDEFFFADGLQVQLQNQIGVGLHRPGQISRVKTRRLTRLPARKSDRAFRRARRVNAGEAGLAILAVEQSRLPRFVETQKGVMHRPAVRSQLNAPDKPARAQWDGDNQVSISIAALGGELEAHDRLHHQVGFAERPARTPHRHRRQIRLRPFRRPFLGPLLQESDLLHRQTTLPDQVDQIPIRQPRRHDPAPGHVHDLLRVFPRVLVAQQREGRGLTGPMAARAVLENNRRDVLVEGDGTWGTRHEAFGLVGFTTTAQREQNQREPTVGCGECFQSA